MRILKLPQFSEKAFSSFCTRAEPDEDVTALGRRSPILGKLDSDRYQVLSEMANVAETAGPVTNNDCARGFDRSASPTNQLIRHCDTLLGEKNKDITQGSVNGSYSDTVHLYNSCNR